MGHHLDHDAIGEAADARPRSSEYSNLRMDLLLGSWYFRHFEAVPRQFEALSQQCRALGP